jgi:hypothetical protein
VRTIQGLFGHRVGEGTVLGGRVIFLDDVNQPDVVGIVAGDGEPNRVGGAISGEPIAASARVAAVAQLTLTGLRRLDDVGRMGMAGAGVGIA